MNLLLLDRESHNKELRVETPSLRETEREQKGQFINEQPPSTLTGNIYIFFLQIGTPKLRQQELKMAF